jgi:hypothetical protein
LCFNEFRNIGIFGEVDNSEALTEKGFGYSEVYEAITPRADGRSPRFSAWLRVPPMFFGDTRNVD